MASETDGFQRLLPEMRELVLRYLNNKTLLSACCVSKEWRRLISPMANIWRQACKRVLCMKDGIDYKYCRTFFVRLSELKCDIKRFQCFKERFFMKPDEIFTAIYYYGGRIATGGRYGDIHLWDCKTYCRLWTNIMVYYPVTSIKFDDNIIVACYQNGSVAALNPSTGVLKIMYENPFVQADTLDFMTDANLVVSAHTDIVGWNMTTGQLMFRGKETSEEVLRVAIGPFPGQENSECPNVRSILIASMERNRIYLRVANYSRVNELNVDVVLEGFGVIWTGCANIYCSVPLRCHKSGLIYDGKFLYFTRHYGEFCNGVVCKWDVVSGCIVSKTCVSHQIRNLLAVGEKYISFVSVEHERKRYKLIILNAESTRPLITYRLPRLQSKHWMRYSHTLCIGEVSWLDGFDGYNDKGVIYASILEKDELFTLEWRPKMGLHHCRNRSPSVKILSRIERRKRLKILD